MSTFELKINEDTGNVRFVSMEGVDEDLRQALLNGVYPTPDDAEFAATGVVWELKLTEDGITTQHAVGICTHFDNVISFGDGERRHRTDFRFHRNGRHYTVTRHERWISDVGWITRDKFNYSVSRKFCGCN